MAEHKHIVFICGEYPPCNQGGIGSFTHDLAKALVIHGFDVTVIGVYHDFVQQLDGVQDYVAEGVRIIKIPFKKYPWLNRLAGVLNRLKLRNAIRNLHKEKRIDLIEAPEFDGWLPIKPIKSVPLITRLHSGVVNNSIQFGNQYSRLAGYLEKQQVKNSDKIVAVSKHIASATKKALNLTFEYELIYNCVQVVPYQDAPQPVEKGLIIYFGAISPKKGLTELFKALPEILRNNSSARLVLAGKSQTLIDNTKYEDILRSFIPEVLQERVEFTGPLVRESELFPLVMRAEICCFPSISEAFAFAPMEAMALGKPVVFTKYASGPEVIEHGVTGLLADTKDPADIARNVLTLLANPEMATQMGIDAQKSIIKRFNYQSWVDSNVALYRNYKQTSK